VSTEAVFVAIYTVVLLVVAGLLEYHRRQPTSAWSALVFKGYRRAVPDAPKPASQADWPHSEVGRFHRVLSMFVGVVAVCLVAAELVRHHRPLEALVLLIAVLPHAVLTFWHVRALLRAFVRRGEDKQDENLVAGLETSR
jgi:hypothetical protein